tara:strand:- start:1669 stop:3324 length:1656 start_codon:yes stop_codon:yes gene_type:complete
MHTIDRFIGEFQSEINTFINNQQQLQLMIAPTGAGKTTASIIYADSNPHKRIVLLCPFRFLVDNIQKQNPNISCGYGGKFISKNKTTRFLVTTYDSIEKLEDVDLFIVDEAHLLASHSSFRDVIPLILQTQTKVVLITATPEVITDLFPRNNRDAYVIEFLAKRPKEEVNVYAQKYNVETIIQDIIINRKSGKTMIVRVNSKKIIDRIIDTFKSSLKDRIAFMYSDEDNVLFQGQDKEKVNELKKGKISEIDILLCTSVYDVGVSFEVDRDIDCYAVSQDNRCMPNAIDMVQLLARVRENSGFKMTLTIIGNYQDYEVEDTPLKIYKSKAQLCNEMAHRYQQYTKIDRDNYEWILGKYNIVVNEMLDMKFKEYIPKVVSRISTTEIVKNFQNFPKEYETICGNLTYNGLSKQIELITGESIIKGLKDSAEVQRVYNILFRAIELEIDFNLFISDVFSIKKFKVLDEVLTCYTRNPKHTFSNLIRGISSTDNLKFEYNKLGLFELNESKAKTIKSLYNMVYKKCDFRRLSVKKVYKEDVDIELVNLVNYVSR